MFQKMAGLTLLEGVLALTMSSITAATAFSYLDDWIVTSEKVVLHYSQ
jgi:type II secretory pathway component PulJ